MKLFCLKEAGYPQENFSRELCLNNFGYYENTLKKIDVVRPNGRLDYHLIYVAQGEISVHGQILKEGDYCVFAPGEAQYYTYLPQENTRYFWIHFTGSKAHALMQRQALSSGVHRGCGKQGQAETLFDALTRATTQNADGVSSYAEALLYALLMLFADGTPKTLPFSRARKRLEDTSSDVSVGELAAMYAMTAEHFIRSFRNAYGVSPANYRIRHRLSQAKMLLTDTKLSVVNIAELCGYPDPFYFSRLFKKHVGVSPTEYRKRMQTP